jgi:cellulose synthase/poly-beta-1,6-N-acetylglucosamine synthase-like glycosyltransferase
MRTAIPLALFWLSVGFLFYSFMGYPLLLLALSRFRKHPVRRGSIEPHVSFIITAHNEEARIREKIWNTLQLRYPRAKLEIIVASDRSTDLTDEIVRTYAPEGIRLVRAAERRGKENAQGCALEAASGTILVFSDVATMLDPQAITQIVTNFADPTVGCVTSTDRLIAPDGQIRGEGAYVRYEMFLRALESRVNSVVGLSGSFFAARKEVCHPWRVDLQSDFNTLLNGIKQGLRGVSDPSSIGYYKDIALEKGEFDRKVRTIVRGITVLMSNLSLLNTFNHGLFAWQLFSHKLCRWSNPFFLLGAFLANILLLSLSPLFIATFAAQVTFYGLAIYSILRPAALQSSVLRLPAYLLVTHLATVVAWYRYCRGQRYLTWNPSQR